MALKGNALTITYYAYDTFNSIGKTADGGNHTLRLVRDGVESTPTNTPTEIDATNAKGIYSLALTTSEMNCNCLSLVGVSSTANIIIAPIANIITEQGRIDATISSRAVNVLIGTAQSGTASYIQLASSAVATDKIYNGMVVNIVSGTGAGQARRIVFYNGTTKNAYVNTPWVTNPDSASTYVLENGAYNIMNAMVGGLAQSAGTGNNQIQLAAAES